jgi:histidinol-phosphate aminotransferase
MEGLEHGATDSGPEPLADFSTCAHPLGPCPHVLSAVLGADRTRYPDPSYVALRGNLAAFHGVDPARVVPGAGASELIQRVVRSRPGDVLAWEPTFVEYRRAALQEGRAYRSTGRAEEWLDLVPERGSAFLCQPNNPDGFLHDDAFLAEAARRCERRGCALVLDLAYAEFRDPAGSLPEGAHLLHAPNKVAGLVGIRAGYLVAPDRSEASGLVDLEASWIVSVEGVAFLRACRETPAIRWVEERSAELERLSDRMRRILSEAGWESARGAAHFGAFQPPGPPPEGEEWGTFLRTRGIRARDLRNVGMPGRLRFSARPSRELDLLEIVVGAPNRFDPVDRRAARPRDS